MATSKSSQADPIPNGPGQDDTTADDQAMEDLSTGDLKIKMLPGSSNTSATFEFQDEDHTLGNALRHIIMKYPEVELAGYSIPHPSEPKMNLRIQTEGGTPAVDILRRGLEDLAELCDIVTRKFTTARDEFDGEDTDDMETD